MGFKIKGPKIKGLKIGKKTLNQIGNVATGAVSGFVMGGGPFGAAAGAVGGSMQGAKKFNPLKSVVQGGIAGGAVGAYKGTGVAGKYIAPKAKALGSKAIGFFGGGAPAAPVAAVSGAPAMGPAMPAVSGATREGPFNLSNAMESVKSQAAGMLGGVFGPSEAMADQGGGYAGVQPSGIPGIVWIALLAAGVFFITRR